MKTSFRILGILALLVACVRPALGRVDATGGDSTNDIGGYRIHTFIGGGTFTVTQTGAVDVLVVAGGGGGGGRYMGGGGGAGGLILSNNVAVTTGGYTVTVGAGGAGGGSATRGTTGSPSGFGAISAAGGGGGGSWNTSNGGNEAGLSGGSGGGCSGYGTSPATATPAGQGNNGGIGAFHGAGGGGGAGAVGGNGTGNDGGAGGAGLATAISGTLTTYAGGGGGAAYQGMGGPGGAGGGGGGAVYLGASAPGTDNTGGGGGGGNGYNAAFLAGAKGGSGIVIVRYALGSPTIANLPATNVTATSAWLNGSLTDAGAAPVTALALYWGTNDGQRVAANWGNTNVFSPVPAVPAVLTTNVGALTPGVRYYYRFYAVNSESEAWASSSEIVVAGHAAGTGGSSTNDIGVYRIHTFTSSGTFTATQPGRIEVLAVAGGGGGGGGYMGGGGGGGGVVLSSNQAVTVGAYTVTVGGGGAGGGSTVRGSNGSNSAFGAVVAAGGGGGGSWQVSNGGNENGLSGGSGGGASGYGTSVNNGAATPAGQGNSGGLGRMHGAGGGGGGGAVGENGTQQNGGAGGAGLATAFSGTLTNYAGGGGGAAYQGTAGAGGSGGGGAGGPYATGAATVGGANTGGGGGGANGYPPGSAVGAAGGTGIVIVRYLVPPGAPTAAAATNVTQTSFWANWSAVSGATAYWLDVSLSSDFTSCIAGYSNLSVGNVSTYLVDGSLSSGTAYYYQVRAQSGGGTSTNSNVILATTVAAGAPVATAATNISATAFYANWNVLGGATNYLLDVSPSSDFASFVSGYEHLSVGNVLTYLVSGSLSPSTTYYYQLRAQDSGGTSTNSNAITVNTLAGPAAVSTVTASPTTVLSDGLSNATITVTLKDALDNPLVGHTVTLAQGSGQSTIGAASGPSDAGGVVTFTVTDTSVETVTYTATDVTGGFTVIQTASVQFVGALSGGTESASDGYEYHVFTSNGTFTVRAGCAVDVLVVAGGGGGGGRYMAGGGGAGGLILSNGMAVTAGVYTVTVGAGGAGGSGEKIRGSNGSNSVFGAHVAAGGGGGGSWNTANGGNEAGLSGGSGGGASGYGTTLYGAASPAGQGHDGGQGQDGSSGYGAGGGGGAGAAGGNGTPANGGAGGAGLASAISGVLTNYAGGGGGGGFQTPGTGGAGGSGGGGAGASYQGAPTAGAANTGGGGGGANGYPPGPTAGASGGSGIVIVRYDLGRPAIATLPATNVTVTSAWLNGSLTATGAAPMTAVAVYWGTNDGQAVAADWGNTNVFASVPAAPAVLTTDVGALTPGVRYYYRYYASNSVAGVWASSSELVVAGTVVGTGGNITNYVGGHRIHTFTSDGTFTATQAGRIEVLVVAGGGGGGGRYMGGGGGGGGVILSSNEVVTVGAYTVTVGAGGAGGSAEKIRGSSGSNSAFGALVAAGGGGGGSWHTSSGGNENGLPGGSGGGASGYGTSYATASPAGQGNHGGQGYGGGTGFGAGGGGGAGTAGGDGTVQDGGAGGAGLASAISGTLTNYAGGGGGAAYHGTGGGSSGGGAGASDSGAPTAGADNTGGGGGGANGYGAVTTGATGGSGIVIVRYLAPPDAPTAVAATNVTQTGFWANWSAVNGATSYWLDVSLSSDFTSCIAGYSNLSVGNVSTYFVGGSLSPGTAYYYQVRAQSSGGTSTNSNVILATTVAASVPVATAATNVSTTAFFANWDALGGATNYLLDVSLNSNFTSYVSGYSDLSVGNVVTYLVSGSLSPGTTYYYQLRAQSGGSTSSNSNFIAVNTVPAAPAATAATGVTVAGFSANWTAAVGATNYLLDVSADGFATFFAGYSNLTVGAVLTRAVSGLSAGTAYSYRLRAQNSGGTSTNSNVMVLSTVPPAPVATAATGVSQSGFSANWGAASGATNYFLDVSANSFATCVAGYSNLSVGATTTRAVSGLSSVTLYAYRLRAQNSGGTSTNSNVITVSTLAAPADTSTVSASPTTVFGNGLSPATITVTLKDGAGNPLVGHTVTLAQGSGQSTISAASGPSDAGGVVTFTVTDSQRDTVTYTATDVTGGFTVVQTASVQFVAAISGGTELTSEGYRYHVFTSNGTFTVMEGRAVDVLVVAGGGGGGGRHMGGGGGAGGLILSNGLAVTSGVYTVTVGAGGVGGGERIRGSNGSNSVFGALMAAGGGGGGSWNTGNGGNEAGLSGGSGGGASGYGTTVYGTASPAGQGNDGGQGYGGVGGFGAGGGGGAGGVGGNGSANDGGAGGAGLMLSISGLSTNYAGGGGGAAYQGTGGGGGSGGGGAGASYQGAPTAGANNTGGGGGGANGYGAVISGATGGSGLVIVRYFLGAPSIETLPASSVTLSSAWLNGSLTDTGGAPAEVWCYWGATDGGTTPSAWAHTNYFGTNTTVVPPAKAYAHLASGLNANASYCFTYRAANAAGDSWAATRSFTTPVDFTAWGSNMRITFTNDSRLAQLTNFPALIALSTNIPGFRYSDFAYASNGTDLRFSDGAKSTNLNYEIERWDTNGTSYVWVQVPLLTPGASIWAYWSNPLQSVPPAFTTNGATWDATFAGVWHCANTNVLESSTNRHAGTNVGATGAAGAIGQALDFNGTSYVDVGAVASPASITVSAWVRWNPALGDGTFNVPVGKDNSYELVINHPDGMFWWAHSRRWTLNTTTFTAPSGDWAFLAMAFDQNTGTKAYANGVLVGADGTTGALTSSGPLRIGSRGDGSYYYGGRIDEVRVSTVARSSNWIWACWMNQTPNSAFTSNGEVAVRLAPYSVFMFR